MYVDNIKLFAKNQKRSATHVQVVVIYCPLTELSIRDAPVQISRTWSGSKWALWNDVGRCRRQLSQSYRKARVRTSLQTEKASLSADEQPQPRWRKSAKWVLEDNIACYDQESSWVNIAVCPYPHPSLTHHRNINPFENKVWKIYIFIKKCVRSFIEVRKLSSIMIPLVFVLQLCNMVRIYSQGIWKEFGIETLEKWAMIIMRRGKQQMREGIELSNWQKKIITFGEKEHFKNLGILEEDSVEEAEMREKKLKRVLLENENTMRDQTL